MDLQRFVSDRRWKTVTLAVNGEDIDFVVFDWDEIKEREEDGGSNVWEYFLGFDGPVFDKVEAGEWIPFGAGNMYAGALKSDGGFQEMGHKGMLLATPQGELVYYDHNGGEPAVSIAKRLDDL